MGIPDEGAPVWLVWSRREHRMAGQQRDGIRLNTGDLCNTLSLHTCTYAIPSAPKRSD